MNQRRAAILILLAVLVSLAGVVVAQRYRGGPYGDPVADRMGVPDWENEPGFEKDVFTFARVVYNSDTWGYRRGGGWPTDWPASDLNFSFRLQQLTSLKLEPDPVTVTLTDPKLFDYPFLYPVSYTHLRAHETRR